jgi:lipoprotein-releasing system ATP-binding protein
MSISETILEARNVTRDLGVGEGRSRILDSIDLRVERGQFVALTGASGSGKSTLLYLLGVLDRPTAGEVLLGGTETNRLDDDARAELRNRRLGFVFQFHFLLPEFTALENVMIPMIRRGLPDGECRRRGMAVLDQLGLKEKAHRRPSGLSGGEQQRVSIARALGNSPEVLLADEPTGNLDSRNAENVFQIFQRLSADGLTLVMVTHDVGLAQRCGRRVELRDGRIIGDELQAPARAASGER